MDKCPRCADMPWIVSAPHFPEGTPLVGRMKPDPDTVMRWCFKDNSAVNVHPEHCDFACYVNGTFVFDAPPCDFGWVERPTRLEEATP